MSINKAESPDSRKRRQSLEWERHRSGSWEHGQLSERSECVLVHALVRVGHSYPYILWYQ